eukprot:scaffold33961_cov112-Isochrysis_galbana.AAC.3
MGCGRVHCGPGWQGRIDAPHAGDVSRGEHSGRAQHAWRAPTLLVLLRRARVPCAEPTGACGAERAWAVRARTLAGGLADLGLAPTASPGAAITPPHVHACSTGGKREERSSAGGQNAVGRGAQRRLSLGRHGGGGAVTLGTSCLYKSASALSHTCIEMGHARRATIRPCGRAGSR